MNGPLNAEWQQLAANAICHAAQLAGEEIRYSASLYTLPSAVMRPAVFKDGNAWCALYGPDIQIGVCGFGNTPAQACAAFDKAWCEVTE